MAFSHTAAAASFYTIALLAGFAGAIADGFLNQWAKHADNGPIPLLAGTLGWNLALILFARLLLGASLARVAVVFLVANTVAVIVISLAYFREAASWQSILGMAIALFGLLVMEMGR